MARIRTTKTVSQRIERTYFKQSYPLVRWKWLLSLVFTVVGVLWLSWAAVAGKEQPYNAGSLANPHNLLTRECASCHSEKSTWGTRITDLACQKCHDAPVHQADAQKALTPTCGECHVEHQGAVNLSATRNATCTQCHSNLKNESGKQLKYQAAIDSFETNHPEFAVVRPGAPMDMGNIKFGHQIHLKKDLRGPDQGKPVQMVCVDCHRGAGVQPLKDATTIAKFEVPPPATMSTGSIPVVRNPAGVLVSPILKERAYMAPIHYEQMCASCHPLFFDKRFPVPLAHRQQPKEVREIVVKTYTDYIRDHPNEVGESLALDPTLPARPVPPPPRNATEWIAQRVEEAERLLWQKTCKECHTLMYPIGNSPPTIPETKMTTRWMANATFDHQAHELVTCQECHDRPAVVNGPGVTNSKDTADVNLPGIKTCVRCHNSASDAASSRCSECHQYHDWNKATPVKTGAYTITTLGR